MRIFANIFIFISVFVIFIIATTLYLSPNDLKDCTAPGVFENNTENLCQKVDAIVAISGGNTTKRTDHAVALLQSGWSSKIIFSGAAADSLSPSNASTMGKQAENMGVSSSQIILEEQAENTKSNAELTKKIIVENNIKSIILTTSGYHQRRAFLEFSNALKDTGVKIINSPTETDEDWSYFWWLKPRSWTLVVSEYVGIGLFYFNLGGNK